MNDVPDTNKLDLREAIGRRYSADDLQVEEGWIKDYALATNDPNPRYLEGEIVAPPIFPVRLYRDVMFKAIGDPEIGLDMLRLVHGEQDMTWHGPIRPGDVVSLQAVIETVAQKSKGCVVAIRKLAIVEGETRVEARMSVFVRGQMLPGVEVGEVLGDVPTTGGEPEGEPIATSTQTVAMDQPKRYAAASLDVNPIHMDEAVAKKAGLPSVILHGLCSMAFACTGVVDELLGGDSSRLHRFAVRFSRPVLPGWVLTTKMWDAGTTADGRQAYQVQTFNQDGVKVITSGWAEVDSK
jgi:acyl dehydratase